MTIYTYPIGRAYTPQRSSWGSAPIVRRSQSIMSGATSVLQRPGGKWLVTLEYPKQRQAERAIIAGLFFGLSGGAHKLAIWDLARPAPIGSINTTGVTCGATGQFSESLVLSGCGAGKTIVAGDKIGVNGQLFIAAQSATANGSGVMTVDVRHMTRASIAGGAAVTLIRPMSNFIPVSETWSAPEEPGGWCPPIAIDLIESP